jgi:uncharacterized membrane protein YqjE
MDVHAPISGGLLSSIRGLADGLVGSAQERFELLSIELHEEKFRAIQLFVWVSAAIFSAILAITFVSLAVVYLFWAEARFVVLAAFALLYMGGFFVILSYVKKFISQQPKPFQGTLAELQQDRSCIQPRN